MDTNACVHAILCGAALTVVRIVLNAKGQCWFLYCVLCFALLLLHDCVQARHAMVFTNE